MFSNQDNSANGVQPWQVVFPWVPLITSDYNILISSWNALQNTDVKTFTSSCEFLRNVILEDFPAEVLLQRPCIVQTLLSRLSSSPSRYNVVVSCLQCFIRLTSCLLGRLSVYKDPMFYISKINAPNTLTSQLQSTSPTSQRSLSVDAAASVNPVNDIRYSGDGQDMDVPNVPRERRVTGAETISDPSPVQEDVELSQHTQLTIPLFCIKMFESSLTLLNGHSLHITNLVTQLSKLIFSLMKDAFSPFIWLDQGIKALEAKDIMIASFETSGKLLHHHRQQCNSSNIRRASKHRHVYSSIAYIACNFLGSSLPLQHASEFIPNELVTAFSDLVFDLGWKFSFPKEHALVVEYVKHTNIQIYQLYKRAELVGKSMHSSCLFMRNVSSMDANAQELLQQAEDCLHSLPFIGYVNIISKIVNFCTQNTSFYTQKQIDNPCCGILLSLFSYPVVEIRRTTFSMCSHFIQKILGVKSVMRESAICQVSVFVEDPVLNHLIYRGLVDKDSEVCSFSENIILALIQGWQQLPDNLLVKLRENLFNSLTVLQSFTSHELGMGSRLFKLVEQNGFLNRTFTTIEKLKLCFRLMFLPNPRIRLESLAKIIQHLAEEDNMQTPDLFLGLNETTRKNISGLFLVDAAELYLKDGDAHSDLPEKISTMTAYLGIIKKQNLEKEVRCSALHQLAILLEDRILHSKFVEEGGLSIIKESLFSLSLSAVDDNGSAEEDIFKMCLKILMLVSLGEPVHRQALSDEIKVYDTVLRGLVFWCNDVEVRLAAVQFFALLVFDDSITKTLNSNDSSLCIGFKSRAMLRYRLPFKTKENDVHEQQLDETIESCTNPLLALPAVCEFLRLSWNISYFGSPIKYINVNLSLDSLGDIHWPQYLMSCEKEQILVKSVLCECVMKDNLVMLSNATTHKEAYSALHALTLSAFLYDGNEFVKHLHSLSWNDAFNKFFQIIPSCKQDEELFGEVLTFFTAVLHLPCSLPEDLYLFLWEKVLSSSGPIQSHLQKLGQEDMMCSDTDFRFVTCQLLTFISVLVASSSATVVNDPLVYPAKYSNLIYTLSIGLNLTGSPHFYNISHLEKTLTCVVHLTAGTNWSLQNSYMNSFELCERLLQILKDVVAAFLLGSPGTYMGKGVVCTAALCLRHIAEEMRNYSVQGWEFLWLHYYHSDENESEARLDWLIPLLLDKNPEVRAAGLGIIACLTTTDQGKYMVTSQLHYLFNSGLFGGVWVIAASLLVDDNEPSIVREQAAWILCNLTAGPQWLSTIAQMRHANDALEANTPESQADDLQELLKHRHFYAQVESIIKNCYVSSTLHLYPKISLEDESFQFVNERSDLVSFDSESDLSHTHDANRADGTIITLTTPPLLSAVCRLLQNLLALDGPETSEKMRQHGILFSLLQYISYPGNENTGSSPQSDELQELTMSVVGLIETAVAQSSQLRQDVLNHPFILQELIGLSAKTGNKHVKLLLGVYKLMINLLYSGDTDAVKHIVLALKQHWATFFDTLERSLNQPKLYEENVLVQKFLSSLCVCQRIKLDSSKDLDSEKSLQNLMDEIILDTSSFIPGRVLCETLMTLRTKVSYPFEKTENEANYESMNKTLQSLFLVSSSARTTALSANLIVELLKEIESIVKQLSAEKIQSNEKSLKKKVQDAMFPVLVSRLEVLQTLFYKNVEAKEAACKNNFGDIIYKLWEFCTGSSSVLAVLLSLLRSYTANCPTSCRSLAHVSKLSQKVSNNSLMHSLIKHTKLQLDKITKCDLQVLTLLFQILSALCVVNECRSIVTKTSFVEYFLCHSKLWDPKSKHYQTTEKLWLDFLVSLTTSTEGQASIISIQGLLERLHEIVSGGHLANRVSAMLVLRNLCFHSSTRRKLLSAGFLVPLVNKLIKEQSEISNIAASVLRLTSKDVPKAQSHFLTPPIN